MPFNAIRENKMIANIFKFTVSRDLDQMYFLDTPLLAWKQIDVDMFNLLNGINVIIFDNRKPKKG